MSTVTEITTQEPRLDWWGIDIGNGEAGASGRLAGRHRDVPQDRSSWLNLGLIGACIALVAALVVHFATTSAPVPAWANSPQVLAQAINLRLSDLPGFSAAGAGPKVTANPGAQFARCFSSVSTASVSGGPGFTSPDFVSGGGAQAVSIGSSFGVASRTELAQDSALAHDPRFPQCFANAVAAMTLTANGIEVGGAHPTATTLALPRASSASAEAILGVRPILGVRARMTWSAVGVSIPVTVDAYLMSVGHDEVALFAFASGRPFSSAREERLLSLLVHRALLAHH
jgi:hypothetical protein